MKKLLLVTALFLIGMSFASADSVCDDSCSNCLGEFKQGESISLSQVCDTCTYVTLESIIYPNSSIEVLGDSMTKDGTTYNYSFARTNLPNGNFIYNMIGDKDGSIKSESACFVISPSGISEGSLWENSLMIILLVLGAALLISGIYFEQSTVGFIGAIMLLLAGIYSMIYGFNGITNLYTRGASIAILAAGLFFMFSAAYDWFGGKEEY